MKYWSIITLLLFLNFTALPSIAAICGWEIPQTNVIINEEETSSHASFVVYEKAIPKTFSIYDFLKVMDFDDFQTNISKRKDINYFSPLLSIFSPPPELI